MRTTLLQSFAVVAMLLGLPSCGGTDADKDATSQAADTQEVGTGSQDVIDMAGGPDAGCGIGCRDMVAVPAGEFMMGCNAAVQSDCHMFPEESPYHLVTIDTFWIDKYETTVAQYKACVGAGGCPADFKEYMPTDCNLTVEGKDSHPVNCVRKSDAEAFCEWAGKRLCSEAEWEKAARGEDGRTYPWGNEPVTCSRAAFSGCQSSGTVPVGSKPAGASPYGALDMIGNVREWVADCWQASYAFAPTDGSACQECGGFDPYNGVMRGGSVQEEVDLCLRCAYRTPGNPDAPIGYAGIRCCTSVAL